MNDNVMFVCPRMGGKTYDMLENIRKEISMFLKKDLKKAKGVTLHLCGDLVSRNGKEYRVYVIEEEDGTLVPEIEERKPKGL